MLKESTRTSSGAIEGIFQASPEGHPLTVNQALARILGYDSPQDLLAAVNDVSQDAWADLEERATYIQQMARQGFVQGFECQLKRKDGAVIWVSLNARNVCDSDGQLLYSDGFIVDISEQKRVMMQLRNSEELYRSTFQQAPVGIIHTTFGGRILRCNARFAELLGYAASELLGFTLEQITAPEDRSSSLNVQEQLQRGSLDTFCWEKRYIRKDGSLTWAKVTMSVHRDSEGSALHLIVLVEDINALKAAEEHLAASQQALRSSEERYRSTFEQAAVGIVHASFDGRFLRCNKRFAEIVGYSQEEIPGMTFLQITLPEDRAESEAARQQLASGAIEGASLEKRYLRKDGSSTWAKVTFSVQRDAEGRALHSIAIVEDINARKAAEQHLATVQQALRSSEERYRIAFQTSIDAINISRLRDGAFIDCNQAFSDIVGYERQEVIGRTSLGLGIWADECDRQKMVQMLLDKSICRDLVARFRKKNGEMLWGQLSSSIIEVDGTPCVLSITRDITQAKLAEEEIRNLAFYDPLTALPNRRLLLEQLRQRAAAGAPNESSQALLFIDLDNFKMLNDTLGHHTGDLLLREVARRLVACVRETDTVGRLGGDEFLVMLEGLSEIAAEAAAQAEAAGEKILASLGQPCLLGSHECLSSASIGVTLFRDQSSSADEILQQADIALQQAKTAGRNTMRFFSPALLSAVHAHAEMEDDLRQAIKTNQFLLYYQPQVARGRLTGAEALIRWRHPVRGIVAPSEFIALAEETGLILPLENWVLETACRQIASWASREQTADLLISINISALQFRQPDFVRQVLTTVERFGVNPRNLRLELTESMLVENIEEVIAKMAELKSHGLSFSLDDFGTGYSSLTYLKRLPLDCLKIDRAFVRDILVDATSGAIAQTVISLGRAMGLSVIAEGVETEEQRGFLGALGCYAFQGYLLSPALTPQEFEAFVENFAENNALLLRSWESYAREIGAEEPILSWWAKGLAPQSENPKEKISLKLPGWRKK
jgi:diguanylate cyclase (GGDEF)-like protein/PAS domain S-box-containing protein